MIRTDIIPFQEFKLCNVVYIATPAPNNCWGCVFKDDEKNVAWLRIVHRPIGLIVLASFLFRKRA
jgi:hypothetical protein